ncbi:hypothetical protein RQP46_004921 [Phenoliferia psychrophenolica]
MTTSLPPPRIDLLVYSPSPSAFIAPLSLLLEPSAPLSTLLAPQLHAELQRRQASSEPLPKTYAELLAISASLVEQWAIEDQAVFLSAHPRIGETKNLSALSGAEQSGKGNDETPGYVLKRLSMLNSLYEESYPTLRYTTFVNGRSRAEIAQEMETLLGAVLPPMSGSMGEPRLKAVHDKTQKKKGSGARLNDLEAGTGRNCFLNHVSDQHEDELTPPISSPDDDSPTPSTSAAPLPWFVDPSTLPPAASPSPKQATAATPLPPPPHLPSALHPLYAHLSVSPFLDRDAITFINAREADPENSWVEWVVVASLRPGREGGLRGAIEGVRTFLSQTPVDISPAPPVTPFSPPSSRPLISGLPTPPSRHARGRKPSPSRAEQASGWAMLDAGNVVVHVMTRDAREHWGIEELWRGVERETAKIGKLGVE